MVEDTVASDKGLELLYQNAGVVFKYIDARQVEQRVWLARLQPHANLTDMLQLCLAVIEALETNEQILLAHSIEGTMRLAVDAFVTDKLTERHPPPPVSFNPLVRINTKEADKGAEEKTTLYQVRIRRIILFVGFTMACLPCCSSVVHGLFCFSCNIRRWLLQRT